MWPFSKKEKTTGTIINENSGAIRSLMNQKEENVKYLTALVGKFLSLCNSKSQKLSDVHDIETTVGIINGDIATMESISSRIEKQAQLKNNLENQRTFLVGIIKRANDCVSDLNSKEEDYEKIINNDKSKLLKDLNGFSDWFSKEKILLATYLK